MNHDYLRCFFHKNVLFSLYVFMYKDIIKIEEVCTKMSNYVSISLLRLFKDAVCKADLARLNPHHIKD